MANIREEWRSVVGWEGLYEVSNLGRVRSKTRYKKVLKGYVIPSGYVEVILSTKNKGKHKLVHRLVCESFIPNPQAKPCVNHKDGNKTNNCVLNLEWVTYSENERHSFDVLGKKLHGCPNCCGSKRYNSKPVLQFTLKGEFVAEYESRGLAAKLSGIPSSSIWEAMNGILEHAGGFLWEYKYQ